MNRVRLTWMAIFIGMTLVLLPNFYRNHWGAVETTYYTEWQTRYDRLVVARLVKTRMHGAFSAGALMGLGNTSQWGFESRISREQFNKYFNKGEFESYLVYRSNPGLQALFYSSLDKILPVSGEMKLKLFRGITAVLTALVFSLILTTLTLEFGILPGLLALLFTIGSLWIVLPAGSIFWDYWGFYLPFVAGAYLLAEATAKHQYNARNIHSLLFLAALIKTLVSGFDLTTTVLVMSTVPFVYHAIYDGWYLKTFVLRFLKAGIALVAGTLVGILTLSVQILANEGTLESAYVYIWNRFGSHLEGDYAYFLEQDVMVRKIGIMEVLPKYLLMPAINLQLQGGTVQVLYWHLIVMFAGFTVVFLLLHGTRSRRAGIPRKSLALLAATWYSLLAPLSWYVIFRPHAFIHTHVNTMGWQMPFTILGFAFCGLVLNDLFLFLRTSTLRTKSASNTA